MEKESYERKGTVVQLTLRAVTFCFFRSVKGHKRDLYGEKMTFLLFVLSSEKENCFLCNPVTPLASFKWCFMSVIVCNCGHIASVLQCLCHSLLFTALLLLVLSIKCVLCFVSPVKMKVCGLREARNKTVPVDDTDSIFPSRWAINGAVNFSNITVFVFSIFYNLHMNLQTTVRPAVPMMRPESVEACCH